MEEKMNKIYEPDDRFMERLEWQLSSEFRRANRLRSSSGRITVPRRTVAIAAVIGVLITGVAVTKAADFIKDSWRKKIEIARVETEVELKKVHLESIREMASSAKSRAANRLIREDEYQAMKLALENAEWDLKRSLLNLDEVKMSGDIPRNELYAPLVGGRDFVSERLMIEMRESKLGLEQLENNLSRIKEMVENKMVQRTEMDMIRTDITARKIMIDKIQKRLDLRARFLDRDITAKEVEIQDRLASAERNLFLAQSKVKSLKDQLERIKILEAQGGINHMEVKQIEFALNAAKAELKLAALEMEVLEKLK